MIKTRFAPSPTGYLHIGGVRTALFNWLLAKRHNGQFILRIDDTDDARNNPKALQPILDGLQWLGLNWDEGPFYQSQRTDKYQEALEALKSTGSVYKDDGAWRFHIPETTLVINDLVRKEVKWITKLIDDPVLVRRDGKFLYNFATVVDDHDMRITHILRAEEHLSNTPVQALLYDALQWQAPRFGHIPFVCAPNSRRKISKREMAQFMTKDVRKQLYAVGFTDEQIDANDNLNPVTIEFYQQIGYQPEALVNYLTRLGWALDANSEKFPVETTIKVFDTDNIVEAPASFDPAKLYWLQGEYCREMPITEKVQKSIPYLQKVGIEPDPDLLEKVLVICGDRIKVLSDIVTCGLFFFQKPVYEEKAVQKRLRKEGIPELLAHFVKVLQEIDPFNSTDIEKHLHSYCDAADAKPADLIHALRVAVTGITVGPGVFDCVSLLGKVESGTRIAYALELTKSTNHETPLESL